MVTNLELRCTLLTDGSSDRVLTFPIRWLIHDLCSQVAVQLVWADLGRLPNRPRNLAERIQFALELYPADILFVHRDAERVERTERVSEIANAIRDAGIENTPAFVCVIPVRMTEAWLILQDDAIRQASGNPHGVVVLQRPDLNEIEGLPDAKGTLEQLLTQAAELGKRRQKHFRPRQAIHRLAQIIDDFSPLRALSAFLAFENDVRTALQARGLMG